MELIEMLNSRLSELDRLLEEGVLADEQYVHLCSPLHEAARLLAAGKVPEAEVEEEINSGT